MRIDPQTHYRDEICEAIEATLRTSSEFDEWTVHRLRIDRKLAKPHPELHDPFDVRNPEGKHMTWLFEYELELLDSPELLVAYIRGNSERIEIAGKLDRQLAIIVIAVMLISPSIIFFPWRPDSLFRFTWGVVELALAISLMAYLVRRRNQALTRMDVINARNDPSFREALRILSILSDRSELGGMEEYFKRYERMDLHLVIDSNAKIENHGKER
ncbi:MAG: hypothetical protein ACFFE2_00325 [Candidatus Thorarchaeota archaeon]